MMDDKKEVYILTDKDGKIITGFTDEEKAKSLWGSFHGWVHLKKVSLDSVNVLSGEVFILVEFSKDGSIEAVKANPSEYPIGYDHLSLDHRNLVVGYLCAVFAKDNKHAIKKAKKLLEASVQEKIESESKNILDSAKVFQDKWERGY